MHETERGSLHWEVPLLKKGLDEGPRVWRGQRRGQDMEITATKLAQLSLSSGEDIEMQFFR